MRKFSQTGQFRRDVKRMRRRGKDIEKLTDIVAHLAKGQALAPRHRAHVLVGNWKNCRACHIEPDRLLIYSGDGRDLRLERTGSHSDLFE